MTRTTLEGLRSAARRSRTRRAARSPVLAVALLAISVLALGAIEIAVLFSGAVSPPWQVVLFPVVAWVYLAAGVVAWLRRPSNRLGAIMIVGALAWIGAGLSNAPMQSLETAGEILATVPLAAILHLVLAFPSGRLRDTLTRAAVFAAYFVALVLQAPTYLFGPQASGTAFHVADRPDLADLGHWVQHGTGAVLIVVVVVILARRLRDTAPRQRYVLAPLYVYAIAALLWVPASRDLESLAVWDPLTRGTVQLAALSGIPVAFAAVILLGGFARMGEIEELGVWLGAEEHARPELRDALATALGDPSLEVAFWDKPSATYVDAAGSTVELPATGSGRAAVEVTVGRRRVGAIVYDETLIAEPQPVQSAGRVVAVALDRERLTAELRASRERLRASRARVVVAADTERRRIARDLHDTLQTRLVLLAVEAHELRSDASARTQAAAFEAGLQTAIGELRELVHGLLPAVLAERGLYAAVEDLAHHMPLPITLELDSQRAPLPAPVESVGYFVVSEALTNAVKHAHAHQLGLRIERTNGQLAIEIEDDGIGGAGTGSGLMGMLERVEAVDGRLSVRSPPGGGTRILAEVPCGP
jgi:signal transduction histidine kinase